MKIREALNEFEKVLINTYKSDGCVTSAITEIQKNIAISAIYKEIENRVPKQRKHDDWFGHTGIREDREHYCIGYNQAITDFKTNLEEIR